MKRSWWRRLAQRLAYPPHWPRVISYWTPKDGEKFPPFIQVSVNGKALTYRSTEARPEADAEARYYRQLVAGAKAA